VLNRKGRRERKEKKKEKGGFIRLILLISQFEAN
jgi:hypothetical protein